MCFCDSLILDPHNGNEADICGGCWVWDMKQVFAHICMWVRLTGYIAVCKLLVLGMGRGSAVEEVFVIL